MPRIAGAGALFLVALTACTHINHSASPAADTPARSGSDVRTSAEAQTASAAPDAPPAAPPPGAPPPAAPPAAAPPAPSPAAATEPARPKTAGNAKPKSLRGSASSKPVPAEQRVTSGAAAPAAGVSARTAPTLPVDKPPAPAPLDLTALEQRLKDTHAIGVFTKLSLKNQVDDLLSAFRAFHAGQTSPPLAELRQRYDLLLLKVLTLLQDGDPPLASAISASREAIWALLADRDKFQKIQVG